MILLVLLPLSTLAVSQLTPEIAKLIAYTLYEDNHYYNPTSYEVLAIILTDPYTRINRDCKPGTETFDLETYAGFIEKKLEELYKYQVFNKDLELKMNRDAARARHFDIREKLADVTRNDVPEITPEYRKAMDDNIKDLQLNGRGFTYTIVEKAANLTFSVVNRNGGFYLESETWFCK
ncbi:unnamed protein product [Caenorhabditis angaria]|uniref:SXP/RAL-2 family protein Ani s 5-like cation-binding domain-containing protein n=1 Tax=Caenorhabditis angaria TaxID=860376 RepID=A0A9P1IF00_9PELO|nr:unnamed protein product [Caenorhabditis angaria]